MRVTLLLLFSVYLIIATTPTHSRPRGTAPTEAPLQLRRPPAALAGATEEGPPEFIYIYIYRERERYRYRYVYVYIYIYIHTLHYVYNIHIYTYICMYVYIYIYMYIYIYIDIYV